MYFLASLTFFLLFQHPAPDAQTTQIWLGDEVIHQPASGQGRSRIELLDVQDPEQPAFAGCYAEVTAIHDAQCVKYQGPDAEHAGKEICVTFNGSDSFSVADMARDSAV